MELLDALKHKVACLHKVLTAACTGLFNKGQNG
jgi:hypothetical protein